MELRGFKKLDSINFNCYQKQGQHDNIIVETRFYIIQLKSVSKE